MMIKKTITQEDLKELYNDIYFFKAEETREEKIAYGGTRVLINRIAYEVEGLNKILICDYENGWVLKDSLSSRDEMTIFEYFDKEAFEQEKQEREHKKQTIEELKEMGNIEMLKACGGYDVLRKLLNGEINGKDAVGDYCYKGQRVFSITNDANGITYWLYRTRIDGMGKEFNNNLNTFCQVVGMIEKSKVPYDIESGL